MIGIEVVLAVLTIWLTIHEARLHGQSQEAILNAKEKIDADLTTVNSQLGQTVSRLGDLNTGITQAVDAVKESAKTSKTISGSLQSQLGILGQQQNALQQQASMLGEQLSVQKQQWEKENQLPVLLVQTAIEEVSPPSFIWRELHPHEILSTGHSLGGAPPLRAKAFSVRNVGKLFHRIAAIGVCALGTVLVHKPFVCDYLIFEPGDTYTVSVSLP